MIIGCRIFSSFLVCGISQILGSGRGTYSAFLRWFWERGAAFPSPINPGFGFFAGSLEGLFFGGSARVFPLRDSWLDSIAAIANWISDRDPPASSSLAFRFSRLTCDLEYGRRDTSTSSKRFRFTCDNFEDPDLLSSNLACLSILFSFFEMTGFEPDSAADNVSRISAAYKALVTAIYDQRTVGWGLHIPSSPSRCQSRHVQPDFPGRRTVALPPTEGHDREPWSGNELPLAALPIQYQTVEGGVAAREDLPCFCFCFAIGRN